MFRKTFLSVVAVLALAAQANAAGFDGVIFYLDINPVGLAGGGSNSALSGANSWHLYALDNNQTVSTHGLYGYSADMTIPGLGVSGGGASIRHKSPNADMTDASDENFALGFNFLRSPGNTVGTNTNGNPIQSLQDVNAATSRFTYNIGKTASSFATEHPDATAVAPDSPNATNNVGALSWGTYNNVSPFNGRNWVFLAEGLDGPDGDPSINGTSAFTFGQVFGNQQGLILANTPPCIINDVDSNGCLGSTQAPFEVEDMFLHGFLPGAFVSGGPLPTNDSDDPDSVAWSLLSLTGPGGPVGGASVDPSTGVFSWQSLASSPRGGYTATIQGINSTGEPTGTDSGLLTFNVVPEPASFTLLGLALIGVLGIGRRR